MLLNFASIFKKLSEAFITKKISFTKEYEVNRNSLSYKFKTVPKTLIHLKTDLDFWDCFSRKNPYCSGISY